MPTSCPPADQIKAALNAYSVDAPSQHGTGDDGSIACNYSVNGTNLPDNVGVSWITGGAEAFQNQVDAANADPQNTVTTVDGLGDQAIAISNPDYAN